MNDTEAYATARRFIVREATDTQPGEIPPFNHVIRRCEPHIGRFRFAGTCLLPASRFSQWLWAQSFHVKVYILWNTNAGNEHLQKEMLRRLNHTFEKLVGAEEDTNRKGETIGMDIGRFIDIVENDPDAYEIERTITVWVQEINNYTSWEPLMVHKTKLHKRFVA